MRTSFALASVFWISIAAAQQVKIDQADSLMNAQFINALPQLAREGKIDQQYSNNCGVAGHVQFGDTIHKIYISGEALHLTHSNRTAYIRMITISRAAYHFYENRNYTDALFYWQAALTIARENKFIPDELHSLLPSINNIFFLAGDYADAMKLSLEGLALAQKVQDPEMQLHLNNALGAIMMNFTKLPESEQYFRTALFFARQMKDNTEEGNALLNLGDVYIKDRKSNLAVGVISEALDIFLHRTLPHNDANDRRAYAYNKLAEAKKEQGLLQEAMHFSLLALGTSKNAPANLYDLAHFNINTGDIYNRLNEPDTALIYLKTGLGTAQQIRHREYTRDAYQLISVSFSKLKRFDSAFIYLQKEQELQDSMNYIGNRIEIQETENNIRLETQRKQQDTALAKQKKWKNISIGSALLIVFFTLFFYNRYRLRQKNIYQQQLNSQQNEIFSAIADTQEQERKRIAQDLHDTLGSVLSAAKLKLAGLKDDQPFLNENAGFRQSVALIDEASSDLRHISYNIMPATLSKLGLVPALNNVCSTISSANGLQVQFMAHGFEKRLPEHVEISVYRMVLELVNNVVRHAAATQATVQMIKYPSYLNIVVEDNGSGFQREKRSKEKQGLGLGSVAARVDLLKGKIDIDSAQGKGTTIIIDIPLEV
jgi:two-component system NarL family sensor kinase